MENVNKKGKLRGKKFVWFERMLRREGRKLCAVALCASMIIGNMAWPAAAANDTSGEYSFELSSESLFDAIQDAIAEGTVVDTELDLKGSAAEEYQSFLEAGSSLYEIEPVIDNEDSDRDKVLDLRAFVRLENDIELDSAYVMDGSEEITFLLVNSSDVYQQATISVDGRESETITVLPASAVAVDEEEVGPGVSGTANRSDTTVTGSGSGSGGSGSGGSNNTTGAADSTQTDESAADDDYTADIVIENNEISDGDEQDSVVKVQPEEGSDEEEQEPEEEDGSTENQQDDADIDDADEDESGTQDETGDVSAENDKETNPDGASDPAVDENTNNKENTSGDITDNRSENDPDAADEPEDSGVTSDSGSDPADEDGGSGTDESGNDNTADDQNDESGEETDDEDGEAGSEETVASAVSVHTTYLLAASATPSDAEEATPSDASDLNGEAYETILLDSEAVVAYVTTAEELELDKIETILYTAELDDVVFSVEVPVGALPWGVELKASEYEKDSETYLNQYAETINLIDKLDEGEDYTESIRLFDIGFYDADGVEVEPTEKVNVTITYLDADANDVNQVVHFGEEETEVINVETNYDEDGNKNISYELESFSLVSTVEDRAGGSNYGGGGAGYGTYSQHIDVRVYTQDFEFTQTLTESSTQKITVNKIWNDSENVDHSNDSVIIYLTDENGAKVNGCSAELNDKNDWSSYWEDLTLNAGSYSVKEEEVTGYTSSATTVEVGDAGESTGTVTVKGSLTLSSVVSLSYTHNGSTHTLSDYSQQTSEDGYPEYHFVDNNISLSNGDVITVTVNFKATYTVTDEYGTIIASATDKEFTNFEYEEIVAGKDGTSGNQCSGGGYDFYVYPEELLESIVNEEAKTITVTNTPKTIDIPVEKVWVGDENSSEPRPSSVTITLYENGTATDQKLILSDEGGWKGTFKDLSEYDTSKGAAEAEKINYTVQEEDVSNYTSKINKKDETGGYIITNTLNTMDITVTKIVTGNMGDTTKKFIITVDGKEFNLAHQEYGRVTGLTVGSTITLKENDYNTKDGYDAPTVTYNDQTITMEKADESYSCSITLVSGATEIKVTNNKTKEVDAGVFLDSIPYVLLLSLTVIPSVFMVFRRQSRRF